MACTSSKLAVVAALALLASCARDNPLFGEGETEAASGSTGGSATTTMGIESSVGSLSSSAGSSTGVDPDSGSEVGSDTSGTSSTPECGNGIKEEPEEQCDEGEANGDEGFCLRDCTKNECGDGHLAPNQPCDDMNDNPDDGCHECVLTSCGNETVEGAEECDDGPKGSNLCTPSCTLPTCGDMFVTPPEQCDDGNGSHEDECIGCAAAFCGDGHTWAEMEECDDQNVDNGDGCSAECLVEFCGDGIVQEDEECEPLVGPVPFCIAENMQEVALDCDPEQCRWAPSDGQDCCIPEGEGCTLQVECCAETSCNEMSGFCESA